MRKVLSVIILCLSLTGWAQTKDLILGGELSNSAATSVVDIDEVMPRMKALGLNTAQCGNKMKWRMNETQE